MGYCILKCKVGKVRVRTGCAVVKCGNTVVHRQCMLILLCFVIERLWKELTGESSPSKLTDCSYDFTKLKCLLVPYTRMIMVFKKN